MGNGCVFFNNNHCLENYTCHLDQDFSKQKSPMKTTENKKSPPSPQNRMYSKTKTSKNRHPGDQETPTRINRRSMGGMMSNFQVRGRNDFLIIVQNNNNNIQNIPDVSATPTYKLTPKIFGNTNNLFTKLAGGYYTKAKKNMDIKLKRDPEYILNVLKYGNRNISLGNFEKNIFEYINIIRTTPKRVITDIDFILQSVKNDLDGKKYIDNEKTNERIFLDEGIKPLEEIRSFLGNVGNLEPLHLNDELKIDFEKYNDGKSNVLILTDEMLAKIILDKRKEILEEYPKCYFFYYFIQDSNLALLFLLADNKYKKNLRQVLFDKKYTQFNVSWTKEKNKGFIFTICLA